MKYHRYSKGGFTLIELLIVIGVITTISVVVILILNPLQLLRQARDANRLSDLKTLDQGFRLIEAIGGEFTDLDGPNYSNSCQGQSSQKIFVSVPADNGEATSSAPAGWQFVRVPKSSLRNIDGTGWVPVDLRQVATKVQPPLSHLPVDPTNTFASNLYYSYVCGSYEFNAVLESSKYTLRATSDGGDDDTIVESGSKLTLTPPRPGAATSSAPIVLSITPSSGVNTGLVNITSITGSNFATSGATVSLAKSGKPDIPGSGFTFVDSSNITDGLFNLSGAATGTWDVVVTNPGPQSGTLVNGFTVNSVVVPAPTVSSVSPSSGVVGSTTAAVSITGSNFQNGAFIVKLASMSQSDIVGSGFVFQNAGLLNSGTFTIPAGAATGTWNVVVVNPDGQTGTFSGGFTISAASTPLNESFTGAIFPPTTCNAPGWTTGASATSSWVRDTVTFNSVPAAASAPTSTNDNQTAWLDCDITVSATSTLTFQWSVSSEAGWDFLLFCLNNDGCTRTTGYNRRISGTYAFTATSTALSAGTHSLRWLYAKDGSASAGSDVGWIDDVTITTP